jgi:flagellar basal-body rod protein FlgB
MKAQMLSGPDALTNPLESIERPSTGSPNGNTVSLEDELMRGAKSQHDHELAISIYRSTLTMMKTAVGKNI